MRTVKTRDTKRAVAYVRVSTDRQDLSPDAQLEAIGRWTREHGARVVATFEDLGISGATPIEKRPGLLQALDALKTHGAGVLIVAKRDRLARDMFQAVMAEHLVKQEGARIMTADDVGNGDDPESILRKRLDDMFAEYERAKIAMRTRAALAVKRRRGEKTGGPRPFGYAVVRAGEVKRLEAEADEQRAIRLIVELRATGLSYRSIAAELVERGIATVKGGRWEAMTVQRIVKRQAAA